MIKIRFLGHASVLITFKKRHIYINPVPKDRELPMADLVLISSYDARSYNHNGVRQVWGDDTRFVTHSSVARFINGAAILRAGDEVDLDFVQVKGVPAHGEVENIGFLLRLGGKTVYFTAETRSIPQIAGAKADVVLVCIGGHHMMGARQAARWACSIDARVLIPTHFGKHMASLDDAQLFSELVREGCHKKVVVLKEDESYSVGGWPGGH